MKKHINTRIELLLAKIAGRNVDLSTMTPPVAMNLTEELMLDIANRMDSAASELPSVTKTDEGKILSVNNKGKWVAAEPASGLPDVSADDNGAVMTVANGEWSVLSPSDSGYVTRVAHIKLWNKSSVTVGANGSAVISEWDMADADSVEWSPLSDDDIPSFDFAVIDGIMKDVYDSNGANIYNLVIAGYSLEVPTEAFLSGDGPLIGFAVRAANVTGNSVTSPADSLCGAVISLYKHANSPSFDQLVT